MAFGAKDLEVAVSMLLVVEGHTVGGVHLVMVVALGCDTVEFEVFFTFTLSTTIAEKKH